MAQWETGWSRDVLERIAALLFALAGLADRAAGLPAPRRRQVLAILGVGEAEARAFLVGGASHPADAPDTAGDATRLAARLCALALLLCALLAQAALPGAAAPRSGRLPHVIFAPAVGRPGAPTLPAFDTS